jgi:myo-inositol-1(or 4)-monophosphatase
MEPLQEFLEFAVETVFQAGRLTLGYFQTGLRPEFKKDDSPVTVADREAEGLIRRRIERRFPEHGIVGEEYGNREPADGAHRWIVDPIDGTKAFVRGVPLYGVLLGLEIEGLCEVGAVYFPALDEMVCAATGLGCRWNGRRVRVADTPSLEQAVVAFTDAGSFARHGRADAFARITRRAYQSAGWSDAYGHMLVATGRVEVMVDPVLHPYDCAPFPPILREAGGWFGDWSGNETIYGNEGLSTTPALRKEVVALLQQ